MPPSLFTVGSDEIGGASGTLMRLWEGVKLPEWNLDRFFELWLRIQSRKMTAVERSEFGGHLMFQVRQGLLGPSGSRLLSGMRIMGLDIDDVGSEILRQTVQRFFRPGGVSLFEPCALTLITTTNVMIQRFFSSELRRAQSAKARAGRENRKMLGEWIADPRKPDFNLHAFATALRGLESELISEGDDAGRELFRLLITKLTAGEDVQYRTLPDGIRERVDADAHSQILYGINRAVIAFAQDQP